MLIIMNTINILKHFRHLYDFQLIHKNKHIGSCKLMIHDKNAVINHIYINDSHKKQGLGSLLLQETEQILKKDHSVQEISLLAWQPSGSFEIVDFYTKNGYLHKHKQSGTYDDQVTLFDLHNLHKKI